jgi:tyrosyl-tRNA synthetase
LDVDTIEHNRDRIAGVVGRFVDFQGAGETKKPAVMVDNAEWLDELAYIGFLREVGRHFTINRMLTMESVQRRLDRSQPLTFLEFNYMLLQAYDFVELAKRYGCTLQAGGSDQWGNIINGVELGRRMSDTRLFGLTAPLLLNAAGEKMGKTVGGAVWLSAELMSPYDFWQYWRNVDDADVEKLLRLFTDLPVQELDRLAALEGQAVNEAKETLATELTALVHGREEADKAAATARETFAGDGAGAGLPSIELPHLDLAEGTPFFVLLGGSGLVDSNSAARRLIKQGGGRINDVQETDPNRLVTTADLDEDGVLKLSAGKKKHVLVRVAQGA